MIKHCSNPLVVTSSVHAFGISVRSIRPSLGPPKVLLSRQNQSLRISTGFSSLFRIRAGLVNQRPTGSAPPCCNPPALRLPRQGHSCGLATMSSSAEEQPVVAASTEATCEATDSKPALPPLSAHEHRQYNRLAEHMNYYHEHFRQTWTMLYNAASNGRRPAGMSIKQYIDQGLSFISHLETHHSIEETYIFPVLARKMPEFQSGAKGGKKAAELLQQHKEIHVGMELMQDYLSGCREGKYDMEMRVLKAKMDTWGAVLWKHLDQEVKTLEADNVRRYFSLEEVKKIPM